MKIYDCFMFYDEEMLLDLRLNIMDKYVDKFIISEATYMHSGEPKKLIFDIEKFSKFKDKIIYNVVDKLPTNLEIINQNDSKVIRGQKLINNSVKRENFQRESAKKILDNVSDEDIIIINDIDEIPNLNNINFNNINKKLIMFEQKTFYYKFNLQYENLIWRGSRACRKKFLKSPQWLRNIKDKKYQIWRLDILLSKKKYNNIHYVNNGGWHFTNIKSPENLERKFLNFLHHQDFEASGLNLNDIKNKVKDKKILYDLAVDQKDYKWKADKDLKKVSISEMPIYLANNYNKYSEWFEN
jgi:beta-1,4-mannosyl-glycoprotein beta-1,4-N-acetylglucosaminyltransferase